MKLVIDITEGYYKATKEIPYLNSTTDMLLIKYGTPLEEVFKDIKAEIESCKGTFFLNEDGSYSPYMSGTLDAVLEIIDKHISRKEQEISERNLKMWKEIFAEEKRRESEDKE